MAQMRSAKVQRSIEVGEESGERHKGMEVKHRLVGNTWMMPVGRKMTPEERGRMGGIMRGMKMRKEKAEKKERLRMRAVHAAETRKRNREEKYQRILEKIRRLPEVKEAREKMHEVAKGIVPLMPKELSLEEMTKKKVESGEDVVKVRVTVWKPGGEQVMGWEGTVPKERLRGAFCALMNI